MVMNISYLGGYQSNMRFIDAYQKQILIDIISGCIIHPGIGCLDISSSSREMDKNTK